MNFVYGGVFALKAGYSGATSQKDMAKYVFSSAIIYYISSVLIE